MINEVGGVVSMRGSEVRSPNDIAFDVATGRGVMRPVVLVPTLLRAAGRPVTLPTVFVLTECDPTVSDPNGQGSKGGAGVISGARAP